MSALPQPNPSVPSGQPSPAPVALKARRLWKIGLPVAALLAGAGAVYALWLKPQATGGGGPPVVTARTARIGLGEFRRSIRVVGQTSARQFANITVPVMRGPDSRQNMTLLKLAKPGTMIKKGELLAQIDAQTLKDHIDDMNDQVQQAENDVKKRLAEQAVDWENLQQTLRTSKAQLDKARLDLKAAEVKTELEREFYRLAAEEQEARYKQLQADLATTKEKHQAEMRILEISQTRQDIHRNNHVRDLEKFAIQAPMNGLVVMQRVERGGESGQIQEGDQVNPGQAIAKIVDLASMQVEAIVNQAENLQFRIGQPARIGLDAFPEAEFQGKIYSIGALAVRHGMRENFYIRTVPLRMAIDGLDPRVIPDLSAWADIEIDRLRNVLVLPLEAVFAENGRDYVYVNRGGWFEKRAVQLGSRNQVQVVVTSGLQAGEEVALERPKQAPK